MEFKKVTMENIDKEHICCAITEKKNSTCVASKKEWLLQRMKEGLVFEKLDVRGKVFIEYLPAEAAFSPIEADGYMFIDCLWVSGQYHGQGYAGQLLNRCIQDSLAKGKQGLVVVSSKGKKPFLTDATFYKHHGFQLADEAAPYFELYYLPFTKDAPIPRFCESAKRASCDTLGFVLYYTAQCPHAVNYAPLLASIEQAKGITIKLKHITSKEQAKQMPVAVCNYALFYNGKFVTNEVLSEKSFLKQLKKLGL